VTVCFGETELANGSYGSLVPNSGSWSIAGTRFDEMFATLLPVGSWFPTAALEQADRKTARPESLHTCRTGTKDYPGITGDSLLSFLRFLNGRFP
jgi:hypothetical protein